jgi:uncharacterized membrane protein HdeD (DUF308 family)
VKTYSEYWTATLVRGIVAIVAGTGVLFLPEMASTILLRPFGVVITILCLAAYGVVDSAIVLATSFMIRRDQPGRIALQIQGLAGATIGILLFALVYNRIDLQWFIYLAALHALSAAMVEFVVARETSKHHGARWCYAASAIAAVSALGLLLGRNGGPRELTWLLFAYLGVFGFNLFALASRMLFAERAVVHRPSHG